MVHERTMGQSSLWIVASLFLVLLLATLGGMETPSVELGTHAVERHGTDAEEVRALFMKQAESMGESFWNRPPCKDGRHRFVKDAGKGRWAVWVLERANDVKWIEITAFYASMDQAKKIKDACGDSSWYGHAYGGL